MICECKRILSSSKPIITRADAATHFSQITYEFQPSATAGDGSHLPARSETSTVVGDGIHLATAQSSRNAPTPLHNIGNTCYMNALLQCCKQILARIPSHLLPQSDTCPLSVPLRQQSFSREDIAAWRCWMTLPVGPQRDACRVLEICFDPTSPTRSSCDRGDCYGALLQSVTSFEAKQELGCLACSYNSQQSQKQCVLHVEPNGDAENSIRSSLTASGMNYNCEACSAKQATHHTRLASLPQFLIVRINKYADGFGVAIPQCVRVAGRDMERIAVIHHQGHTPESGHYTATVAPEKRPCTFL